MANQTSSFRNNLYTLFVETSLQTRLSLVVADEDTVGDAKHKILTEHRRCFPLMGDFTIQSLKVKRKGCFFNLSESMPVTSAFVGVVKSWYIYVDASSSPISSTQTTLYLAAGANTQPEVLCVVNDPSAEAERNKNGDGHFSQRFSSVDNSALPQAGSGDLVNKLVPLLSPKAVGHTTTNVESGQGKFLSNGNHLSSISDADKRVEFDLLEKPDLACDRNEVLKTNPKSKKEKSKKRKKDTPRDDVLGEEPISVPIAKKPRSMKATLEGGDPGMCVFNENTSNLENVTHENSLEGKKKTRDANLKGSPDKQLKDAQLAHRESGKKKDSLNLDEKVDSALVPSSEKPRHENSREHSTKPNDDLAKDAALTSQQNLSVMEVEIQDSVVEKVVKKNSVPCSSLGEPHAMPAALESGGDVHLDSAQDVDMGGVNLKSRVDTSEKTMAVGVRKGKKSKKDQSAIANEAERNMKDGGNSNPLDASDIRGTEDPESRKRKKSKKNKKADSKIHLQANNVEETISLMPNHENSIDGVCPAVEVNNEGSIPSETEAEKAMLTIKDVDVPTKLIEPVPVTEAQDPSDKRKKKTRKTKASSVKKNVDYGEVEHVEGAKDTIQPLSEYHKASLQVYPSSTESKEKDNILSQTIGQEASKLDDIRILETENTSLPLAQTVSFPQTADNVDDEVTRNSGDVPPVSTENAVMEPRMKEKAVNTEDPSFSTKQNKVEEKATPKKTRKSKSKKDTSVKPLIMPEAENGTESLQQPPSSTISESTQTPSNVLDNVNGSKDEEGMQVLQEVPDNHEFLTPAKEVAEKKQDKVRKTKAQGGDKHKAEASAYKVSRRKPVDYAAPKTGVNDSQTCLKVNSEAVKKTQVKKTGKVLNGTQNQKSVLAAPKTIFSDTSTESSEDKEDARMLDSDATTLSPSDSSSSSHHSDMVDLNSPENGSYARRKMESGGNRRMKSQKARRKDLDLDTILRSSKSYKAAKLSASQSQPEEDETLPIQFNLDT